MAAVSAQVAADLRAAADVLERDGWTQEVFHALADEGRICHCAEGAIQFVVGRHVALRPDVFSDSGANWVVHYGVNAELRYEAAESALCDYIDSDAIPRWNDAPGRTAAEVIAALRAAADRAEAEA